MSENSENTVRFKPDPAKAGTLSDKAKARLDVIKDGDIDYGDIPELPDEFWRQAASNPYYWPVKQSTTIRIDADVLAWLKSKGAGYQTRINAILRKAMLADIDRGR